MANLVIFAGSQEIKDKDISKQLNEQFKFFLEKNQNNIDKILFGGQNHGVMGLVNETAKKIGITIKGYSIEKYRKYDEGN